MSHEEDLARRLTDFYASDGGLRAPNRVLSAALATIETTQQRRVFGVPWRFPRMNTYARLAVAAAAVVAVIAVGFYLFGGKGPAVSGPSLASPSPSPTQSPTPTLAAATMPPLTGQFTSAVHGASISYPVGWQVRAATAPWAVGVPQFQDAFNDVMYDNSQPDLKFYGLASQPLDGRTGAAWVAAISLDPGFTGSCRQAGPVTVDGASGTRTNFCTNGLMIAAVSTTDRGYLIVSYGVGDPTAFDELLATVRLAPQDAVDATATP